MLRPIFFAQRVPRRKTASPRCGRPPLCGPHPPEAHKPTVNGVGQTAWCLGAPCLRPAVVSAPEGLQAAYSDVAPRPPHRRGNAWPAPWPARAARSPGSAPGHSGERRRTRPLWGAACSDTGGRGRVRGACKGCSIRGGECLLGGQGGRPPRPCSPHASAVSEAGRLLLQP
jgi:hypothetical protein